MKNANGYLEKFNLTGKNALITGGAGLLGFEHAIAILSANGNVVLWDLDTKQLSDKATELANKFGKERVFKALVDVTDETQISEGIGVLIIEGIEIDILINNVAANPKYSSSDSKDNYSSLEKFRLDDWN